MRRAWLVPLCMATLGLVSGGLPAAAHHNGDDHSANLHLLSNTPQSAYTNSDLAFWGDRAYAGNYGGFRIFDISDPSNPVLVTDFSCPSSQNDISVWDGDGDGTADLLFLSVDGPRVPVRDGEGNITQEAWECGAPAGNASDPDSFEGVRVFDISNEAAPEQVAAVPTDCGSHTHTVLPGKGENSDKVYVYVSSYPLGTAAVTTGIPARAATETTPAFAAGMRNDGTECVEPEPDSSLAKQNGMHNKISIITVDSDTPETADDRTAGSVGYTYANVVERALDGGTRWTHRPSGGRSFDYTACHDITFFQNINRPDATDFAAAACWEEGQFWDVTSPTNPKFLRRVRNDDVADLFHSATFSWDGKVVAFEDEAGGGVVDRCLDPEDKQGRIYFYNLAGRFLGDFKIPRAQMPVDGQPQNCTAHNYNTIPLTNGRYILVSAWYQGGTSIIDYTNPANAKEIAHYDARSPVVDGGSPIGSNAWSSYWYDGYVYVNDISRGFESMDFVDPRDATAQVLGHLNPQVQEGKIPQTYASTLTIGYRNGAFRGRVGSLQTGCLDDRTVTIKRVRPGADATVGSTTTDAAGRYSLARRRSNLDGGYYAVAPAAAHPDGDNTCGGAASRRIRL